MGSGLPTLIVANENADPAATAMAYLPFHNVLVEPVPGHVSDFMIDQALLLIHKMCVLQGLATVPISNVTFEDVLKLLPEGGEY